jgi:hypothetical protein
MYLCISILFEFIYSVVKTENARRLLAAGVVVNYDSTLPNVGRQDLLFVIATLKEVVEDNPAFGNLYVYAYI